MIDEMFEPMADEIFEKAGIKKEGNQDWYKQVVAILSAKIAMLSATEGMSWRRVTLFEEQKKALVQDMIDRKRDGQVTL